MRALIIISVLALLAPAAFGAMAITVDDFAGGVTAVNGPNGAGVYGTYYDITNDTFGTPAGATMPVGGSAAMSIADAGFTNGVYCIYNAVVPFNDNYTVSCDIDIIEDAANSNGVRAYEIAVQVNGVHRATDPSDLVISIDASAEYSQLLDATDNSANPPETMETGTFAANAGDDILIAFCTRVGGNYDTNSGTWGTSLVYIDNITLNAQTVPVELSVFTNE